MSKNIVMCYDGTGAQYGENNTNVIRAFEAIVRDEKQVVFYDPGVGTHSFFKRTTIGRKLDIFRGKAFGVGLQQNIEDGYEYLMNRFEPADKVFLFGFSRGAFTVRALAGMIHRFGILQKGSINLIPYVSKMYNKEDFAVCKQFKDTFSQPCEPHFIGVWDTVSSLGYIHSSRRFYDPTLHSDIKNAYHAISIDEKRRKFQVVLFDETQKTDKQTNATEAAEKQNVEQVWFAGVHSDVGGWYKERGLSDIALAWMMDKASDCGLKLKENWDKNLRPDASDMLHKSRTGIWRLWPTLDRQIPEGARIHKSVIDRMEKDKTYKPTLPKNYGIAETESSPL